MLTVDGKTRVEKWQIQPIEPARIDDEKITAKRLLLLLASQDYKCAVTGRELTPDNASLDHKVPLSKGGSNLMSNAQIVHWDINKAKGTMTESEFLALCRDVVAFADEHNAGS